MKKKTNKIIISLIIVFVAFILGTVFGQEVKADTVKETRQYYLKANAYNGNDNQNVSGTNLKSGNEVWIVQGGRGDTRGEECNIVNQNNTFCIQRGTRLAQENYKRVHNGGVSSDGDAALAFILCNGGNLDGMLTNGNGYVDNDGNYHSNTTGHEMIYYEDNKQQIAIWNYIICNKTFALEKFKQTDINGGNFTKGNTIYTDAYTYKTLYDSINPTVELVCDDGQNVKANYSGMKDGTGTDKKTNLLGLEATAILYKDGQEAQRKTLNLSNSQVTFDVSYDSQYTYKCEISCTYNKYSAAYCILDVADKKTETRQTILTIIEAEKILKKKTASDTVEKVESKINISMQKYISLNGTTSVSGRLNCYSKKGDRNYIIRNASSTNSANASYKYENPVEITGGTKVTYTIIVYNNGEEDFSDSSAYIIDRIPNSNGNYLVDENSIEVKTQWFIRSYIDVEFTKIKENSTDEINTLLQIPIGSISKGRK